jgi:hemerythrin-like metal-binding protein
MLFEWKPEYSVKVEEIDIQHKRLFALINELHDAINSTHTKELLNKIIDELVNYSVYHFDTEEKYFDKFHYKFSDEHKKEHELFKKKVVDIVKRYKNNEINISFEIIDFLEDWIIQHVTGSDHKYVECFQEHGLK